MKNKFSQLHAYIIHGCSLSNHEARDSKLRYLGRMSPEEQVDKYLKSVEKVNAEKEARFRDIQFRVLKVQK